MPWHATFCNSTGDREQNWKIKQLWFAAILHFPGTLKMDPELSGRVRAARALREKLAAEELQRAPTLSLGEYILQSLL